MNDEKNEDENDEEKEEEGEEEEEENKAQIEEFKKSRIKRLTKRSLIKEKCSLFSSFLSCEDRRSKKFRAQMTKKFYNKNISN